MTVLNAAVWAEETQVVVVDEGDGSHGLVVRERRDDDPASLESVRAAPIPDLFAERLGAGEMVDYMHVSMEGAEPTALSIPGWAERVRSLRVEVHPSFGYHVADCVAQLEALGFAARPVPELPDKWVYAVRG